MSLIYPKAAKQLAVTDPSLLRNMIAMSQPSNFDRVFDEHVYVMECDQRLPGMVFYKVGQSYQPQVRAKQVGYQMGWGNWSVIHLMNVCGGVSIVEKTLHYLFRDKQALRGFSREIFKLTEDDIMWVKSLRYLDAQRLQNKLADYYWDAYNRRYGIQ